MENAAQPPSGDGSYVEPTIYEKSVSTLRCPFNVYLKTEFTGAMAFQGRRISDSNKALNFSGFRLKVNGKRSESRQDFRLIELPKLLASFATVNSEPDTRAAINR